MTIVVLLFISICLFTTYVRGHCEVTTAGSTPTLKDKFFNRCESYQVDVNPDQFCDSDRKNCTELWNLFVGAFAYKPACGTVSPDSFTDFMSAARHNITKNKSLFYSGTRVLAFDFADRGSRYFPLELTLAGFMLNGLQFCGQEEAPGINYSNCPGYGACPEGEEEAMKSFWTKASEMFARSANGEAQVMLNGSLVDGRGAFNNKSIFTNVESKFIDSTQVSRLRVMLVHTLGVERVETCNSGQTLPILEQRMKDKNITYECIDDPAQLTFLQCVSKPDASTCMLMSSTASTIQQHTLYLGFVFLGVLLSQTYFSTCVIF